MQQQRMLGLVVAAVVAVLGVASEPTPFSGCFERLDPAPKRNVREASIEMLNSRLAKLNYEFCNCDRGRVHALKSVVIEELTTGRRTEPLLLNVHAFLDRPALRHPNAIFRQELHGVCGKENIIHCIAGADDIKIDWDGFDPQNARIHILKDRGMPRRQPPHVTKRSGRTYHPERLDGKDHLVTETKFCPDRKNPISGQWEPVYEVVHDEPVPIQDGDGGGGDGTA